MDKVSLLCLLLSSSFFLFERQIEGESFNSVLTRKSETSVIEQFGPFSFELGAKVNDKRELILPVKRMYVFGLRVPAIVKSESREFQNSDGQCAFDVKISCLNQLVVKYSGHLKD